MADISMQRKLRAIFSADVKGYSKLMGDDDEHTIKTITEYRKIITELIEAHHGRVVDAPDDNILAEFESALNAVNSAIEIQKKLEGQNSKLPDNRRMDFRIGINLGDIVHREDRIYGDGVNVAARIESLADPGGICISRGVFDQVKRKVRYGFEYLGMHEVKSIKDPVRIYRILLAPEYENRIIGERKSATIRTQKTAALVFTIILIASAFMIWMFSSRAPEIEPALVEKMAYPLPDKPSIAVLPFVNMSGDDSQEYLSDGFTEDLITTITKIPGLFVISRQSTFTYKDKPVSVKTVAEDLGIRYVLDGSVQKSDEKIRINVQLIDALKGHFLWSERYDRKFKDIFKLKDDIILQVSTELAVELTDGERARSLARYTNNLEAWETYLLATKFQRRFTKENSVRARELYTKSLSLDPNFLPALMGLAFAHWFEARFGYSDSPKKSFDQATNLANKAIGLNDTYYESYLLLSQIFLMKREFEKAETNLEKAHRYAPNDHNFHAFQGLILNYLGQPRKAIEQLKTAMRISPYYPTWYLYHLGLSYHLIGQHEKAIEILKKGIDRAPDQLAPRFRLVAVYSDLGRMKEAIAEVANILRIKSDVRMDVWYKANPWKSSALAEYRRQLLRKAGLPDKPSLALPEKPSIAVLPFDNMSNDPKQEYFSDGITEEIITALSKTPKMFVIARNSTFYYKGKPVKIKVVAEELGVRYVLEGSVRKDEERIRITAQLIDTKTGHHIWAERYDRELKDVFALQDEITIKIISALQVNLTDGEIARISAMKTQNLEAYLKAIKGREYFLHFNENDNTLAQRLAKEAIAMDPGYSYPYVLLAWTHYMDIYYHTSKSPKQSMSQAFELARKALSIDSSMAPAHILLAYIYLFEG